MARIEAEIAAALPALTRAVFSQPTAEAAAQKLTVRPLLLKGERVWQVEKLADNKAFHQNLKDGALLALIREETEGVFRQVLIQTGTESRQYVLKRDGSYKKTGASAAVPRPGGAEAHDRAKEYLLREGEEIPALVDLGVFTKDYRIVRARYDKYRQINRFVELVDQTMRKENAEQIRILDVGCGKTYLTFILYWYFSVLRGMDTTIIGYDLKRDVVERCNEIAARYGYNGLRFEVADVTRDTLTDTPIDMVVTLHACDTATDHALAYAIRRRVKHIFSVPCCQHEINNSIHRGGELDLLLEHGIIKERVSALLTDAVRAAVLESEGYETDMIEFVDFEHSPKNLMIRAEYTGRRRRAGREKAEALRARYGFEQSLLELIPES